MKTLKHMAPKLLKALGITILAFILSTVLMRPFSFSASAFLSNPEKSDFAITDFYSIVADSRPVRTIDDDIVVINLNGLDREGIAQVLELMPLLSPAAVGLDVAFVEPRDNDSRLLAAIAGCPNLVMPVALNQNSGNGKFSLGEISFFADSTARHVPLGATNLPARYAKSTIREFRTFFPINHSIVNYTDSIPSFVVAVAQTARPSLAEVLARRGNTLEMINYPSRSFRIFNPEEIVGNAHLMAGKILLLGDTDDLADMHATPVTSTMSGVMIHAHALSTIIHNGYLDSFTKAQNLTLAFALCLIIVLTSVMLPIGIKGLIMRITQVALLYFVVRLGYSLFLDHNMVIDFSYALLMLAFGLFACDIWIGLTNIWLGLRRRYRKLVAARAQLRNLYIKHQTKSLTPPVNPIIMKKLLLVSIISALGSLVAVAQYSIHSLSGDVKLKKGMQFVPVAKGTSLTAADVLELGEGASIEIFNTTNSQTYKCVKPGLSSVSGIIISATSLASNKGKSIRDNMNFSRSSASGTGHVYVESGMVKRTMATYDPEARNIEVDPRELSRFVVNALRNPDAVKDTECPAAFTHTPNPHGGLSFSIGNTLSSPIYFNVIKVADNAISKVCISELGQPSGSYVLLPAQTISREHLSPMAANERHILIMTHFNFDVDKLIEQIETTVQSGDNSIPDSSLNVYFSIL